MRLKITTWRLRRLSHNTILTTVWIRDKSMYEPPWKDTCKQTYFVHLLRWLLLFLLSHRFVRNLILEISFTLAIKFAKGRDARSLAHTAELAECLITKMINLISPRADSFLHSSLMTVHCVHRSPAAKTRKNSFGINWFGWEEKALWRNSKKYAFAAKTRRFQSHSHGCEENFLRSFLAVLSHFFPAPFAFA